MQHEHHDHCGHEYAHHEPHEQHHAAHHHAAERLGQLCCGETCSHGSHGTSENPGAFAQRLREQLELANRTVKKKKKRTLGALGVFSSGFAADEGVAA